VRPLLDGVRVLDLGIWRPVPYATQLLVEMGADVLKVEPPGGDPMRVFPPLFDVLNAGKRSIVVDLKELGGREEVLALAAEADAMLEGFRPGVADRLGVGYEDVRARNRAIVYCSISGYGATGPMSRVPGHDLNYQALAGVLTPRGGEPVAASIPVGDLGAGMTAAMATVAACLRARETGEGERIDVAIADVLATWTGAVGTLVPRGSPVAMQGVPGYGIYRTSDGGGVSLGVLAEDDFWAALCRALGLEEIAAVGFVDRVARRRELDAPVAEALAELTEAEALTLLEEHDVPVAPILTREQMLEHEHFRRRGTVLVDAETPGGGAPAMGHPARYSLHPARRPGPVPELDDMARGSWLAR
jgi:crotonobetainyl-CoA:carnitine CoA-transferase CaiB-like acyl-CoA transferase